MYRIEAKIECVLVQRKLHAPVEGLTNGNIIRPAYNPRAISLNDVAS